MIRFKIESPDKSLSEKIEEKINGKTKPRGSLGQLENLAKRIALIQNSLSPKLVSPHIIVFAGDHGITEEGVSPYPQEVTHQMVENFLADGAAINVFASQHNIELLIVDAGVNFNFPQSDQLLNRKIGFGTKNFLHGSAMQKEEMENALNEGAILAEDLHKKQCNVIGFGDMGIGNTSASAIITHLITLQDLDKCVGKGTGVDEKGLKHKKTILQRAIENNPVDNHPLSILQTFGGFEIAMMVGAFLKAAEKKMIILVDGFIAGAALLIANALYPPSLDYCIFSHLSGERGHKIQLKHLKADPLLNLGLRLGEGSGAALAYPLVKSAVAFLEQMASFHSAGVTNRK